MSAVEEALALQIMICDLPNPQREYRFAAHHVAPGRGLRDRLEAAGLRDWRFDFAWVDYMIAVEAEGGKWLIGRHQRPEGFEDDCRKYNAAQRLGWRVFRYTTDMIDAGEAIDDLIRVFREEGWGCQR